MLGRLIEKKPRESLWIKGPYFARVMIFSGNILE